MLNLIRRLTGRPTHSDSLPDLSVWRTRFDDDAPHHPLCPCVRHQNERLGDYRRRTKDGYR